jgi:hypothetical protein
MFAAVRILRALPLLLVSLVFACSYSTQSKEVGETDYIRMLREEFFKTHPDGKYNENITRGEVVRGMDYFEVLASWGNPIKREKPTPNVEYWLYLEEDEDSGDWVQYKLVFRASVLEDWELARHTSQGRLGETERQSPTVLRKGSPLTGSGTPTKK